MPDYYLGSKAGLKDSVKRVNCSDDDDAGGFLSKEKAERKLFGKIPSPMVFAENGSILITHDPVSSHVHNFYSTIDGCYIGCFTTEKKASDIGSFSKSYCGRVIAHYSHFQFEPQIVINIYDMINRSSPIKLYVTGVITKKILSEIPETDDAQNSKQKISSGQVDKIWKSLISEDIINGDGWLLACRDFPAHNFKIGGDILYADKVYEIIQRVTKNFYWQRKTTGLTQREINKQLLLKFSKGNPDILASLTRFQEQEDLSIIERAKIYYSSIVLIWDIRKSQLPI